MIDVDVQLIDPKDLREKLGLGIGGRAQKALDNHVIKFAQPYVPFESGTLANSPYSHSNIGSGEIVYKTEYAHYMYYGVVYGPNIPIFEAGFDKPVRYISGAKEKKPKVPEQPLTYSKVKSAFAGPFWIDRMKAARIKDLERVVENAIANKQR